MKPKHFDHSLLVGYSVGNKSCPSMLFDRIWVKVKIQSASKIHFIQISQKIFLSIYIVLIMLMYVQASYSSDRQYIIKHQVYNQRSVRWMPATLGDSLWHMSHPRWQQERELPLKPLHGGGPEDRSAGVPWVRQMAFQLTLEEGNTWVLGCFPASAQN